MPQDAAAELCIDNLALGGKFMCRISRIKQEKSLHLGLEIVDFFFFFCYWKLLYLPATILSISYIPVNVFSLHKFAINGEMIA